MRKLWLNLCWIFGSRHRVYSETEPTWNAGDLAMDALARKMSGNRLGWGKNNMVKQRCRICGIRFWSLAQLPFCKRRKCYVEWHTNKLMEAKV